MDIKDLEQKATQAWDDIKNQSEDGSKDVEKQSDEYQGEIKGGAKDMQRPSGITSGQPQDDDMADDLDPLAAPTEDPENDRF